MMESTAVPGGEPCSLAQAMGRVGEGCAEAFKDVYEGTSAAAFGVGRRLLGDESLAEDVVIETFEYVWNRAQAFDPARGTVRAWVAMIARSRALNLLERRARVARALPLEAADQVVAASSANGSLPADRGRAPEVDSALDRLPGTQRTLIEGAFFEGLSHSDLAKRTNLPLGTVKSRIRLGLARLRQLLQGPEVNP